MWNMNKSQESNLQWSRYASPNEKLSIHWKQMVIISNSLYFYTVLEKNLKNPSSFCLSSISIAILISFVYTNTNENPSSHVYAGKMDNTATKEFLDSSKCVCRSNWIPFCMQCSTATSDSKLWSSGCYGRVNSKCENL